MDVAPGDGPSGGPPRDAKQVHFGSTVTILREDGRRQTYRIVGEDEADPALGTLSYVSPVAQELMGKEVGDVVLAGAAEAEIVAISVGHSGASDQPGAPQELVPASRYDRNSSFVGLVGFSSINWPCLLTSSFALLARSESIQGELDFEPHVVFRDIDSSGRRLTEQARAEIEMIACPIVLQHDEFLAEIGAYILEARLQAPDRFLLAESMGDGDDDGLRHARVTSWATGWFQAHVGGATAIFQGRKPLAMGARAPFPRARGQSRQPTGLVTESGAPISAKAHTCASAVASQR